MSLAIQCDQVVAVLLADGWHKVAKKSFDTDAYEFMDDDETIFKGGQSPLVCSTGFVFREDDGHTLYGPLTAVLAVRVAPSKKGS